MFFIRIFLFSWTATILASSGWRGSLERVFETSFSSTGTLMTLSPIFINKLNPSADFMCNLFAIVWHRSFACVDDFNESLNNGDKKTEHPFIRGLFVSLFVEGIGDVIKNMTILYMFVFLLLFFLFFAISLYFLCIYIELKKK